MFSGFIQFHPILCSCICCYRVLSNFIRFYPFLCGSIQLYNNCPDSLIRSSIVRVLSERCRFGRRLLYPNLKSLKRKTDTAYGRKAYTVIIARISTFERHKNCQTAVWHLEAAKMAKWPDFLPEGCLTDPGCQKRTKEHDLSTERLSGTTEAPKSLLGMIVRLLPAPRSCKNTIKWPDFPPEGCLVNPECQKRTKGHDLSSTRLSGILEAAKSLAELIFRLLSGTTEVQKHS